MYPQYYPYPFIHPLHRFVFNYPPVPAEQNYGPAVKVEGGQGEGGAPEQEQVKPKRTYTRRKKKKEKVQMSFVVGHWSEEENRKYHLFLEVHHSKFKQGYIRKYDKTFKAMSNFLGTRKPDQCRSHHQKMEKKYGTFFNLLKKLRLQYLQTAESAKLRQQLQKRDIPLEEDELITEHFLEEVTDKIQEDPQNQNLECQ